MLCSSFGSSDIFLPLHSFLFLGDYEPRIAIDMISNPAEDSRVPMPADKTVITVPTDDAPDNACLVIMVNNWAEFITEFAKANRTRACIKFIVLFLC